MTVSNMLMTAFAYLREACCHITYSDLYPPVFNQGQMKAKEIIIFHTNAEQQSVDKVSHILQRALLKALSFPDATHLTWVQLYKI